MFNTIEIDRSNLTIMGVKFSDLKDQKKELAPQLAAKTGGELIMRVGNVAVLYRAKPIVEKAGWGITACGLFQKKASVNSRPLLLLSPR